MLTINTISIKRSIYTSDITHWKFLLAGSVDLCGALCRNVFTAAVFEFRVTRGDFTNYSNVSLTIRKRNNRPTSRYNSRLRGETYFPFGSPAPLSGFKSVQQNATAAVVRVNKLNYCPGNYKDSLHITITSLLALVTSSLGCTCTNSVSSYNMMVSSGDR